MKGKHIVSMYKGATGSNRTDQFCDITELWERMTDPQNEKLIEWSKKLLESRSKQKAQRKPMPCIHRGQVPGTQK